MSYRYLCFIIVLTSSYIILFCWYFICLFFHTSFLLYILFNYIIDKPQGVT